MKTAPPTRRKPRSLWPPLAHLVLLLGGLTMLLPLLWMASTSLKAPADVMSYPPEFIPRDQEMWKDPQTGREYPVFEMVTASRGGRLARLATSPGAIDVVYLSPTGQAGRRARLRTDGAPPKIRPVKHVRPHWENYPEAFNALQLQRNWMSWDLPYQLNLGFVKLGPFHFDGLPLRNAFFAFYLNSLFVTILVTVGGVFTSSLAAFAFSRLNFPGRDRLFLSYLGTMMVPQVVTMIPIFVLLKMMGWIDTYAAMILPPMFTAYGTFLLRQFFSSIPTELEDAARMDGCGLWGIYRHVIVPLSGPALATLTTFIFLGTWNSFMWPLIVVNSMEKRPLMLGLYAFMSQYNTEWALLMAASLMVMAPVIIVFLIGQRYFVRGIVLSGLK
jgi:multiple sugar transport system permease protein